MANIDQPMEIAWENGRGNIVRIVEISQVSIAVEIASVSSPVSLSLVKGHGCFSLNSVCDQLAIVEWG